MKGLLSVLSSVFVGLMLAATNFAPILGLHRFIENRRRVGNALMLAVIGFFSALAFTLLVSIDLVIQYEDQGLFFWNPILSLAAGLGVVTVICFAAAKAYMPKAADYLVFTGQSPLDKLNDLIKGFAATKSPAPQSRPAPTAAAETAPNFAKDAPFDHQSTTPERPVYAH